MFNHGVYDAVAGAHGVPTANVEPAAAHAATPPRITIDQIENLITAEHYFTALQGARMAAIDALEQADHQGLACMAAREQELGLLMFCVLLLRNGFKVTGESACASQELFEAQKGREAARANAVSKIWMLEGYLLKQMLHERAILATADEAIG